MSGSVVNVAVFISFEIDHKPQAILETPTFEGSLGADEAQPILDAVSRVLGQPLISVSDGDGGSGGNGREGT